MTYSPTETIFDFRVTEIPPERVQTWQERAEYLLDEAAAGAASFQAVDAEVLREQRMGDVSLGMQAARPAGVNGREYNGREQNGWHPVVSLAEDTGVALAPEEGSQAFGRLQAEISGLLDVKPDQIRVFPDAELPAIRQRGDGEGTPPHNPMPILPHTVPDTPATRFPATRFVETGQPSRFLNTPSQSTPAPAPTPAPSLLSRPAPALGKVPAPAAPAVSLTAGQIRFLDEEIAHLYEDVKRVLATRREITGHALSLLREAREIILTEPHRLARAEYNLNQVRSILERANDSRRQSSQRGFRVLLYLSLWLAGTVGAGVALFLYGPDLTRIARGLLGSDSRVVVNLHPFLWTLIAGSTGAVVGTILGFLAHIRSENDFDRQHVVRFAIQPMMGVVLGFFLYALFSLLFLSMQLDLTARAVTRALPVVLALPVGLWQEWIYASLYRLMGFFTLRPRRR